MSTKTRSGTVGPGPTLLTGVSSVLLCWPRGERPEAARVGQPQVDQDLALS